MEDGPRVPQVIEAIVRAFDEPLVLAADAARRMMDWLDPILFVLAVALVARLAVAVASRLVLRVTLPERIARLEVDPKQVATVRQFLRSAVAYGIYVLAVVVVLARFGLDPSPFLVGAGGLVAIAIGFGSQGFVQDVVTGLFVLVEKQYAVGDFVEIGPVSGFVEEVGIRVTRVRDVNGALRLIPNRTVLQVGNYPKGFTEALVDVFPEKAEALDRVEALVGAVGRRLDEELDVILAPPHVTRPLPSGAPPFVRATVRILPNQHWAVDRELVGRIKAALAAEGIDLGPSGIRVVYQCDRVAFYNNLNRIKARWTDS
ncbi:MAG TPA: mechanosensitive ion channel domain-containing protein [Thermodesulfobacteriota bacterium]